jgi:hypothetical protein
MRGFKPNHAIWKRVNAVIMGESAADVIVTFISAMCALLVQSGVSADETDARVHLAAMLLSPDDAPPGSLVGRLQAELQRLNDGRWLT